MIARSTAALLVALLLAGCGGGRDGTSTTAPAKRKVAPRPALCGPLSVSTVGRVADPADDELSGLAVSRRQRGVLWAIEDSGNAPDVIALEQDGTTLGRFTVPDAQNVDWEEIAVSGSDLYVADIGDNDELRDEIVVYRLPEPDAAAGGGQTAPATRIALRYPDGPHDAEALLVDPRTRELLVVSKDLGGIAGVYSARSDGPLRLVRRLDLSLGGAVTASSVSPDGRTVAMRTYTDLHVWPRRPGERLSRTLRRRPCTSPTPLDEGQGEALALLAGGRSFLTVPEGPTPPVRRYEAR